MPTNADGQWSPSENMLAVARAAAEVDFKVYGSISAICDRLGVARQCWYEWWRTEPFPVGWIGRMRAHYTVKMGDVMATAFDAATEKLDKSIGAADRRLLSELLGMSATQRVEVTSTEETFEDRLNRMVAAANNDDDSDTTTGGDEGLPDVRGDDVASAPEVGGVGPVRTDTGPADRPASETPPAAEG